MTKHWLESGTTVGASRHLSRRGLARLGFAGWASLFFGCSAHPRTKRHFEGEVLILGAGAAGLTAAHLLRQLEIPFRVIEAGRSHGGRMRHRTGVVDFPLPLGAEWLEASPRELGAIVNDRARTIRPKIQGYRPSDEVGFFTDGELTLEGLGRLDYAKFVGSSWLDFFDTFIVPGVIDQITFGKKVTTISQTQDRIIVTDAQGTTHSADAAIVTLPLGVLKRGDVRFEPALPTTHANAIATANVWGGIKVFVEFTERFYPTFLSFPDSDTPEGQRNYYDAAYGHPSQANVLGLFAVGAQAKPYQALSDEALRAHVLAELDAVFGGAASRAYVQHVAHDWSADPLARGAYLADVASPKTSRTLAQPVGRICFAGEAYTRFDDWGYVHTAARSARDAVFALTRASRFRPVT